MLVFKLKVKIPGKLNEAARKLLEEKLDTALNDIADFIGAEADRILRDEDDGAFDTGFLANSLVIDKDKKLYKEVGFGASYGIYIEMGTRPHHPPIKPIYDWIWRKRNDLNIKDIKKNTVTLRDGNTYNVSLLKITMAIIKNIEKHGTEAHPFLRPAFHLGISKANEFLKDVI